jgi:enoyl-CoA hydratase/carnithine racemase
MIAKGSPDAVVAARAGLRQAWETADVESATEDWLATWLVKLEKGENMKEGLAAFTEKRAPRWRPAKL